MTQQKQRWKNDPVAYLTERLGLIAWGRLDEIAFSVRDKHVTIAKSANSIGKTEIAAGLALWWLETHEQAIVLVTGANWNSVSNVLMPRIRKYVKRFNIFPDARINDNSIWVNEELHLIARSTNEPEGIQGYHSPFLLEIVEETSGVAPEINNAIKGNATGDQNRILYLGNPLAPHGEFFDLCTTTEHITISALEHPNVVEGREIIAGARTRASIERDAKDWCRPCEPNYPKAIHLFWMPENEGWYVPDHRFTSRVLGLFPSQSSDSLISAADISRAVNAPYISTDTVALGCDVARYGDDETVIAVVSTSGVKDIFVTHGKATTETAGRLTALANEMHVTNIGVDDTGLGGGVSDTLGENGVEFEPVVFAQSSSEPERFANLKAEICWKFKEEIESNTSYSLCNDAMLIRQAKEIRYGFTSRGQIVIEKKEEYKKRVGFSPDRFEAVVIGHYALTRGGVAFGSYVPQVKQERKSRKLTNDLY